MRTAAPSLVVLLTAVACGPAARDVVEPGELPSASGRPAVARIVDLGDLRSLPVRGALPEGEGDGVFTVGELVLIEGDSFGRQPAVAIGGRSTQVMLRTAGGGIVCRVPPGVAAGEVAVEVSHRGGAGAANLSLTRFALAVVPGTGLVHVLELDGKTLRPAGSIPLSRARDVAISPDGQAAYVTIDPEGPGTLASLAVISLAAKGGPRLGKVRPLDSPRAELIEIAGEAPIAAVWGGGRLTVLDLGEPRRPDFLPSAFLPGPVAALALSPDGRRLAALLSGANDLVPIELTDRSRPKIGPPLDLLPGLPALRDVAFAPGGGELWVLSGGYPDVPSREPIRPIRDRATPLSAAEVEAELAAERRRVFTLAAAPTPARLTEVDWTGAAPVAGRTVALALGGLPRKLAVSRDEAIGSATAVRSTRQRAVAVVSTAAPEVWGDDSLATVVDLGGLAQVDLDGGVRPLGAAPAIRGALALTPDAGAVLALALLPGDGELRLQAALHPVVGGEPVTVDLGGVAADRRRAIGGLAIAP